MGKLVENIMEKVVEDKLNQMLPSLNCCTCNIWSIKASARKFMRVIFTNSVIRQGLMRMKFRF